MTRRIARVPSRVTARLAGPAQAFIRAEAAGGLAVLAAAIVAFAWANSPWSGAYADFWAFDFDLDAGAFSIHSDLRHAVNDGLMAFFFFVIGLEIRRELTSGELASRRKAALPIAAAVGGMVLPAAIYALLNAGGDGAKGWGIPMATDIAFALAVMALLGRKAPPALRVFLLALAVADDLGAIAVIAVFYTGSLDPGACLIAVVILALIGGAQAAGVRSLAVYGVLGLALWFAVYKSGIHATVAGVALAMLIPARAGHGGGSLEGLEHALHPWSVFLVMPLFALANAGVEVTRAGLEDAASSPITLGVAAGLLLGKPAGVLLASWLAVRSGAARLPENLGWAHLAGAGLLAGIGFTVSLFITDLAFDDAVRQEDAKLGILGASVVAALAGYAFLRLWHRSAAGRA
jgi:NhaA family Na+:H+ antiporter